MLFIVKGLDVSRVADDHVSDFSSEDGGIFVLKAVTILSTNGLQNGASTNTLSPTASSTYNYKNNQYLGKKKNY